MSLNDKPHYTLRASALADWIESKADTWWSVDGDPHLMSVLDFPCPGEELAAALRGVGKDLLIYDKTQGSTACGQNIGADKLVSLADTRNRNSQMAFLMSWNDSDEAWLLLEDDALVPAT